MTEQTSRRSYINHILLFIVAGLLLWLLGHVLLLIFAGFLLSVLLNALSCELCKHSPLSRLWSLGIILIALTLFFIGFGFYLFPELASQFSELRTQIPEAFSKLRDQLESTRWAQGLFPERSEISGSFGKGGFKKIAGVLSSTLGALGSMVLVLFIGIYISVEPKTYKKGILALIPKDRMHRVESVMDETDGVLRWWLVGKLASMAIIAVSTSIGLAIIGVPMALILGFLAGLLSFIPNIGPILSAVPAVLLAFTIGTQAVFYTLGLYVITQVIESYLITPFIQRKTISMPPVLILAAQLIFGVLFGFLGLLLATPIAAIAIVLVQNFYVEDYLGKEAKD